MIMSLVGLAVILGLEKLKVPGGILLTIIGISIVGLLFDPNVHFSGIFAMPSLSDENGNSLIGSPDIMGALNPVVLPSVLALVMTAVFDATGTIRAVAGQANLLDKDGQIIDGGKALTTDSLSSVFSGSVGAAPAAVYIESAAGTAAGGKTGLTAITVGVLFLLILFLSPLSYLVPVYATAPALMYVGLLMLSNVAKIDFADFVDAMAGLVTAVFIVLTCNIVTGIMIGFATLVVGRLVSGEWRKLNIGTVVIAVALVAFMPAAGLSSSAFILKNGRRWPPVFIFRTHHVTFCVNLKKVKPRHDASLHHKNIANRERMEIFFTILIMTLVVSLSGVFTRVLPFQLPLPLMQIAVGALLAWPTFGLHVEFDPELFPVLFIPPLLFADGWKTPTREFLEHGREIFGLALALVW